MKRIAIVYGVYVALKVAIFLTLYVALSSMSIITSMALNLILPTIALFIASVVINFGEKSTIKTCLIHAIVLSVLTLAFSLAQGKVLAYENNDSIANSNEAVSGDWLDQLAIQKMIEEGLIEEGEEIYTEPYVGDDNTQSVNSPEQLYAEWDVQMVEQTPLATVTEALFNLVVAFLGGIVGLKVWNSKSKNNHEYIKTSMIR